MKRKQITKNQFLGLGNSAESVVGPELPDNYLENQNSDNNGTFLDNLINNAGSILSGVADLKDPNKPSNQQENNYPPPVKKDNTGLVITIVLVVVALGFGIYLWKTRG